MDTNALFEKYSREQLIDMIMKYGKEIIRFKTMLTACAEEMHRLGSNETELMAAAKKGEATWITGYSIGSYNQMRSYILRLEAGPPPRRPEHIESMFKARSDYQPQPEATVSAVQAMETMQNECIELRQVMVAAAEEIHEHWDDHCDEEGYGPANLMRRLEKGIAVCYPGYTSGAFQKLERQVEMLNRRLDLVREQRQREAKDPRVEVLRLSGPTSEAELWTTLVGTSSSLCPWRVEIVRTSCLTKKLRLVEESGDEVRIAEIVLESSDANDSNLSVLYQFINAVTKTMHMKHKWPMWWKLSKVNTFFRLQMPGNICYTIVPIEGYEVDMLNDFFNYLGAVEVE